MREGDQQRASPAKTPTTTPQPMQRPVLSWIAVAAVFLLLVLLARTLTAYPLLPLHMPTVSFGGLGNGLAGDATATPALTTLQQNSGIPGLSLQNIAMASATEGWATGYNYPQPNDGPEQRLLLFWNGVNWTNVSQMPGNQGFSAIAALPGGHVWVSADDNIYSLEGDSWQTTYTGSTDTDYQSITSLDMLSPTEGWAIEIVSGSTGGHSLILRYHEGIWSHQTAPSTLESNYLRSISFSADGREGWAVGSIYKETGEVPLALHYSNGAWQEADDGLPGAPTDVVTLNGGITWAVGIVGGSGPGYIARWVSGAWRQVDSPTTNQLHAITMRSATDGEIAGDGAATLHYANGVWQREGVVIHGIALDDIAMTGPGEGWAVGGPVMLREHGGVWRVYQLSL